jgi:small subunit ribosomal protein S9
VAEEKAVYRGTGKRKTSVARVRLVPGEGKVVCNGRTIEEYFPRPSDRMLAMSSLVLSGQQAHFDVLVKLHGALRHGVARALCEADPALRGDLKRAGFLTRDAREVERKKAGFKKARRKPQFSKR